MLREVKQHEGSFLSVSRGALCLSSAEPKEGYEEVSGEVDGRPYKKYIRKFAGLDGLVTGVDWDVRETKDVTYRGLKVTVKDGGETYILELPYGKRPFDTFCKTAENIDFSQKVEFVAWTDKEDVRKTAFAIKQDGQFVQWKYTKDNMGECPSAVQNQVTGTWNFDDQPAWLLDRIINHISPMVKAMNGFDEPVADETDDDTPIYTGPEPPEMPPMQVTEPPQSIKDVITAQSATTDDDIPW